MLKIAHIINPVKVAPKSDLFIAQPITFESMRRAAHWAERDNKISITLLSTQYIEDQKIIPDYIHKKRNLTRSVLDEGEFVIPRKLPLIVDILDKLSDVDSDYFVYTNTDIGLMPYFYTSISKYISDGYDALIINRRTISDKYNSINDLPCIYAEIGEVHKGYDCFVFSKRILPILKLGKIAIGVPGVGIVLFVNLFCLSQQFILLDNHHLTFHIGNDKQWNDQKYTDYKEYNREQLDTIYRTLKENNYPLEKAIEYHKSVLDKNNFLDKAYTSSALRMVFRKFIS